MSSIFVLGSRQHVSFYPFFDEISLTFSARLIFFAVGRVRRRRTRSVYRRDGIQREIAVTLDWQIYNKRISVSQGASDKFSRNVRKYPQGIFFPCKGSTTNVILALFRVCTNCRVYFFHDSNATHIYGIRYVECGIMGGEFFIFYGACLEWIKCGFVKFVTQEGTTVVVMADWVSWGGIFEIKCHYVLYVGCIGL